MATAINFYIVTLFIVRANSTVVVDVTAITILTRSLFGAHGFHVECVWTIYSKQTLDSNKRRKENSENYKSVVQWIKEHQIHVIIDATVIMIPEIYVIKSTMVIDTWEMQYDAVTQVTPESTET